VAWTWVVDIHACQSIRIFTNRIRCIGTRALDDSYADILAPLEVCRYVRIVRMYAFTDIVFVHATRKLDCSVA
jgi:hypothetical protein